MDVTYFGLVSDVQVQADTYSINAVLYESIGAQ